MFYDMLIKGKVMFKSSLKKCNKLPMEDLDLMFKIEHSREIIWVDRFLVCHNLILFMKQ